MNLDLSFASVLPSIKQVKLCSIIIHVWYNLMKKIVFILHVFGNCFMCKVHSRARVDYSPVYAVVFPIV